MKKTSTIVLLLISFLSFGQVPSESIKNIATGMLAQNDAIKVRYEIDNCFINSQELEKDLANPGNGKIKGLQDIIEIYNKIEYSRSIHGINCLTSISMDLNTDSLELSYTNINEAIISFNIDFKSRVRFINNQVGKDFQSALIYLIDNEYRPRYFCVIYNYLCFMKAVYKSDHSLKTYETSKKRVQELFNDRFKKIDESLTSIFKIKLDNLFKNHISNEYRKTIDTIKTWGWIEAKLMNYSTMCYLDSNCVRMLTTEDLIHDIELIPESTVLYNEICTPNISSEIKQKIKSMDEKSALAIKKDMYRDTYKPMIKSLVELGKIIVAVYTIELKFSSLK